MMHLFLTPASVAKSRPETAERPDEKEVRKTSKTKGEMLSGPPSEAERDLFGKQKLPVKSSLADKSYVR